MPFVSTSVFRMTPSSARLKSIGARPSPCFKPLLYWNLGPSSPWILIVHLDKSRVVFVSLTSLGGIPKSSMVLYRFSLFTLSYAYLKSTKSWYTSMLCSQHFLSTLFLYPIVPSAVFRIASRILFQFVSINGSLSEVLSNRSFNRSFNFNW